MVKFNSFWICPRHPQLPRCLVNVFFFICNCKFIFIKKKSIIFPAFPASSWRIILWLQLQHLIFHGRIFSHLFLLMNCFAIWQGLKFMYSKTVFLIPLKVIWVFHSRHLNGTEVNKRRRNPDTIISSSKLEVFSDVIKDWFNTNRYTVQL